MPKSRAHKEETNCKEGRQPFAPSKKEVGSPSQTKSKQYNFPKDTGAVGPHYKQPDLGVTLGSGIIK